MEQPQKGNTGVPLPRVILCTRSHRQKGWAAFAKQGSCQPSSKAKPKTSLCFLPRTALPRTIRYLLPTSGASVFLEWSPPPVMTNDPNADVCPLSSQRPHPSPGALHLEWVRAEWEGDTDWGGAWGGLGSRRRKITDSATRIASFSQLICAF